jgi:hypothetical protein
MTKLISALLLVGSFAFASSAALADSTNGNKTGFTTNTSQGGSGNTCTAGSPGCTTTTQNGGGNNSSCTGPQGQCK